MNPLHHKNRLTPQGQAEVAKALPAIFKSGLAFARRNPAIDSDDAVQEAALATCGAAFRYDPNYGTVPFTWLFGALKLFDRHSNRPPSRKEVFRRGLLSFDPQELEHSVTDDGETEADIDRRELVQHLMKALNQREIRAVEMRFACQCSLGEIGVELGITKERVRQILLKALAKMRELGRVAA